MVHLTNKTFVLAAMLASSSFAATDVWFGDGYWEPDSTVSSPLYSDEGRTEKITANTASDLANYNIIFDGYTNNGGDLYVNWGQTATNYTVAGIVLKNYNTVNWHRFLNFEGKTDIVLNVTDDFKYTDNYITNADSSISYSTNLWQVGLAALNIGGNLEVTNSKAWLGTNHPSYVTVKKAHISGDVVLSGDYATLYSAIGTRTKGTGSDPSATMGTFDNADLQIDGVVNFGTGGQKEWLYNVAWIDSGANPSFGINSYIRVGGLVGEGKIMTTGYTSDSKTVLAFNVKNGKSHDFTGLISTESRTYTPNNTSETFDIEIRNEDGGVQTLRLIKNVDAYFTGNITAYGGTLFYGNTSDRLVKDGEAHNNLILKGGNVGAAAATAPNAGDLDIGTAYFNDIVWDGGKILVDVASASQMDKIVGTSLSGTAAEFQFVFNYEGDYADLDGILLSDFFEVDGLDDSLVAKMAAYDSGNNNIGGFISNGLGDYIFVYQIPEPAAVAAVLGAFALAIAAYRRRK